MGRPLRHAGSSIRAWRERHKPLNFHRETVPMHLLCSSQQLAAIDRPISPTSLTNELACSSDQAWNRLPPLVAGFHAAR